MKKETQKIYRQPKPVPVPKTAGTLKQGLKLRVSKSVVQARLLKAQWHEARWHEDYRRRLDP
jgi:hypothetical protein